MGKLDTITVNGPEGEIIDWDAVDWRRVEDDVRRLRRRIFTATQAGDLKRHCRGRHPDRIGSSALPSHLTSLQGLLEPVAWKAGTAGS